MVDLGVDGQEINAKKYQLFIGTVSNQWRLLQNVRTLISHPIFREPTTDGGVVLFTGAFDGSISGSLIFTRDEWENSTTNDFRSILDAVALTGEVPGNDWIIRFTDVGGVATNATLTFSNAKVSVIDINKSVEGGVKVDITIVCPDFPATSS